ncbi:MAG: hypothetical protein Q9228_006686 [Teloschistes exilis]
MILQDYRALTRLLPPSLQCLDKRTLTSLAFNLARVSRLQQYSFGNQHLNAKFASATDTSLRFRTYATTAVSRPKAHTGRTASAPRKKAPAAKATTSDTTSAAKKPAAKKSKATSKPKSKSKSTAKGQGRAGTKAKSAKARKQPKAKAAPKKTKKVQTPEEKERLAIKALKAEVLEPPKQLPTTAYTVLVQETTKAKPGNATSLSKEISTRYHALSPEEREHYNHVANQNLATNASEYRKWIQSYSPAQIATANSARVALRRRIKGKNYPKLVDERQVTRVSNQYTMYYKERYHSGDFKGMPVVDAAKLISKEWHGLDASQRKPYQQAAGEDLARYEQEVKAVYNRDVVHKTARAA